MTQNPERHPKRHQNIIFEQGCRKVALKSAKISLNKEYLEQLKGYNWAAANGGVTNGGLRGV